jgi:hypothetical protein
MLESALGQVWNAPRNSPARISTLQENCMQFSEVKEE